MAGYSLVIDISSDEENTRHSTPLKTVPVNMVGRLDLSDSSTEVYRGSDAELESIPESPAKETPTPKKKKRLTRVSFALHEDVDSDDYYEEPETPTLPPQSKEKENFPTLGNERKRGSIVVQGGDGPSADDLEALYDLDLEDRQFFRSLGRGNNVAKKPSQPPFKPCRKVNAPRTQLADSSLNDLNEPIKPPEITQEEREHFENMVRELEEEEKRIARMTAGRGRGPHQMRNYLSRPSVLVTKEIPHCHGLPTYLARRGALSRPAPGRGCEWCFALGRGRGRGYCKYH